MIRQVLREIINEPQSDRKHPHIEPPKLADAVVFLEHKIERQNVEIQVLSQELANEIRLKEQLLRLLSEEREKNAKPNYQSRNSSEAKRASSRNERHED